MKTTRAGELSTDERGKFSESLTPKFLRKCVEEFLPVLCCGIIGSNQNEKNLPRKNSSIAPVMPNIAQSTYAKTTSRRGKERHGVNRGQTAVPYSY